MAEAIGNPPQEQSNLQALRKHLNDDSLATRLIDAALAADPAKLQEALKKVISDRLAEVRQVHAGAKNK